MVENAAPPASDASATVSEPANVTPKVAETLETQTPNEAIVESAPLGGTESTCNNNNAESSAGGADREGTLEVADELAERGSTAFKENDYAEAADCFSRALEIRVAHYGELAVECLNTYYQYGRALLYKAQEEADPLVSVPKKDGETQQEFEKEETTKNAGESSVASVTSNAEVDENSTAQEGATEPDGNEEDEGSDSDDAGEDDSDLDLAWKMLDVARVISEKQLIGDTMEKVDILSALAEVALEREDIESSLGDYLKALAILLRIVEPDSRQIAELNFRICMCLELGSKPLEAIPYCQNAISICKSRMQRLTNETKSSVSAASAVDNDIQQSNGSETSKLRADRGAEIATLSGLCEDLEKKLEDLQQLASNPKSILSEILGLTSARASGRETNAPPAVLTSSQMSTIKSSGDLDSCTVSTAHSNGATTAGVTHLGVVGRGVKRVLMTTVESSSAKRPATEPSSEKVDNHLPADNP